MNIPSHEIQEFIDLKTKEGVFPEQIYLVLSEYIKSKSESEPNQTTDLFMDMKNKSREQMIEICVEDPQSIRYVSEDLRKDVDFLQSILFRFKSEYLYEYRYDGCGYEPFKGISRFFLGYNKIQSPVFTNKTIIKKLLEIDPLGFKIASSELVCTDGDGNLADIGTNINRDKVWIIIALSGQKKPKQVLPYVHANIFNDLPFIRQLVREERCDLSDLLDHAPITISNEQKTEFQNDSELCISSVRFHSSTFHLCSIDLRSNREFVYECIDAEVISCPGKNIFPYMGEELKNDANLFRYAFQKEIRRSTNSSRNYGCLEAKKTPDVFQHMGNSLRSDMIFLKSFIQDYTKSLSKNAVFNLSYLPREILDEEDFQEHCISVHKKYRVYFREKSSKKRKISK
jgi:hypothetical protein